MSQPFQPDSGRRGSWIAPMFIEHTGARLVAVADVVRENLAAAREKFAVEAARAAVAAGKHVFLAKPVNNAEVCVETTLSAILGREAAYREAVLTWDELMQSTQRLEGNLKLDL